VNLALQYKGNDNYEKAFALFEKSMELNSNDAGAWANLGSTYGHAKRFDEAIECFDKSLAIDPNLSSAFVDKGYALALQGKFSEAWPYLYRRLDYFPPVEHFRRTFDWNKLWQGKESVEGKRVVVWCEQGIGDMIHFSRFLKDLQDRGAYVIVHCPGPIVRMFQTNNWGNLVTEDASKEEYDFHCSMIDIPMFLRIPDTDLGLRSFAKSSRQADLSEYKDYFKIGIVWAGNPRHPSDQKRSTQLSFFRPIHNLPGVKIFNMQKDLRARAYANHPDPIDLTTGCDDMKIIDCSPFLDDFDDTAAILSELDLLISVDTSVLHIGASIGIPCIGLLYYNPDWRWCADGETSVWYPTLKLLRQPERDNWGPVFDQVAKEVKFLMDEKKSCCVTKGCVPTDKGCGCCG
jgi:tetratricopeptide (TPR) repeat protein